MAEPRPWADLAVAAEAASAAVADAVAASVVSFDFC